MPSEVVSNIYLNYGVLGLIIIAFFVLLWWVVNSSVKREEKLYKVIDSLSGELPKIRITLDEIPKMRSSLENIELKMKNRD